MAIRAIFNSPVTAPKDPGAQGRSKNEISCNRHPPMLNTYITQGSDKVSINGQRAPQWRDKTICNAKIDLNDDISSNGRIGGGTATLRDNRNGKSKISMLTDIIAALTLSGGIKVPRRHPANAFNW
ncbi:TPA: hypothetical protein QDZ34_001091 [Stenotrophomonas maltophilia]|nr:hypothetical protein [Stenotrophomonas maltophilia]HDS1025461.1 hypothetical protein [Stenotrophomonas maltophilia]HDS1029134.1 hypothetical protein [Stenotrophomonas maltophilia]HDS1033766.1 hypothetical protein [Stenotrophomonas maltophilia]